MTVLSGWPSASPQRACLTHQRPTSSNTGLTLAKLQGYRPWYGTIPLPCHSAGQRFKPRKWLRRCLHLVRACACACASVSCLCLCVRVRLRQVSTATTAAIQGSSLNVSVINYVASYHSTSRQQIVNPLGCSVDPR